MIQKRGSVYFEEKGEVLWETLEEIYKRLKMEKKHME